MSEAATDALSLVVTELVTHAVLHRGSPDVTLRITLGDAKLTVDVRDAGHWRGSQDGRHPAAGPDATCGRGLELVRQVTTGWLAVLSPAGTWVVASLPTHSADS